MGGKPRAQPSADWRVYLVECADGSLYAGIAVDVERRIAEHDRGRGARYTRGRGPVRLLAQSPPLTRGEALRLEHRVKRRPAREKAAAVTEGLRGDLEDRQGPPPLSSPRRGEGRVGG